MVRKSPHSLGIILLAGAMLGCSGGEQSGSAGAGVAEVVAARQENFKHMKDANDAIKREAEADTPDPAVFRTNAAILIEHAAQVAGGFPAGSGPQEGIETDALPAIWQDKAGFETRARHLESVLAQFSTTAAGDDMAATVAGVALVGEACRECHQQFRQRD